MRRETKFLTAAAAALLAFTALPLAALAQEEAGPRDIEIPNPMAIHTWFIIIALGAFLAWCISYALDMQKERLAAKPHRNALLHKKDELLDHLAELESQKEADAIPPQRYEKEYRKTRAQLSEVLGRLGRGQDPAGE